MVERWVWVDVWVTGVSVTVVTVNEGILEINRSELGELPVGLDIVCCFLIQIIHLRNCGWIGA